MSGQAPTSLRQESDAVTALPQVPSHRRGLDKLLYGRGPDGSTTLIGGGPGAGKTLLGPEFPCRSAVAGRAGAFVSFEERAETRGSEQHQAGARTWIEASKPDHAIVDAISAAPWMGADKGAFDYHRFPISDQGSRSTEIPGQARPSLTGGRL